MRALPINPVWSEIARLSGIVQGRGNPPLRRGSGASGRRNSPSTESIRVRVAAIRIAVGVRMGDVQVKDLGGVGHLAQQVQRIRNESAECFARSRESGV
jgi:hypothetical protein